VVTVDPHVLYEALSDPRCIGRWSPECTGARISGPRGTQVRVGTRFHAFDLRGRLRRRTECRVVAAEPGRHFAYEVIRLGAPVDRWGFRLEAVDGGTRLTRYWEDLRFANRGRALRLAGRVIGDLSGRPLRNRQLMYETLRRMQTDPGLAALRLAC